MSGKSLDKLFDRAEIFGQEVEPLGYDVLDNQYRKGLAGVRDSILADLITSRYTGLKSVVIIGHAYPIALIHSMLNHYPGIDITIMSNSSSFVTPRDYTARLFGSQRVCALVKNPIFDIPPKADLYILPETEFLVPLSMLPYKFEGRVVLCNVAYSIYHHTPTARIEIATDLDHFKEIVDPYGDYFEQRMIQKGSMLRRMFIGYSK